MKKRQTSIKVPNAIKYFAKFLEIINPKLALIFAIKLFYRPIRFPRPERELELYNSAQRDFFEYNNKKVRYYKWLNGDKKILLVHGWSGRATQMHKIIQSFADLNYSVYSFDAPAHGESEGKTTHMLEFSASIEKLSKLYGGFDMIIGHSIGGIATMHSVKSGAQTKKLAVIGTPNRIENVVEDFCMNLGLGQELVSMIVDYVEKRHGGSVDEIAAENLGKHIEVPILIIHDKQDVDVLYSEAEQTHSQLPNSTLYSSDGLGHNRILSDPAIVDTLIKFEQNQ